MYQGSTKLVAISNAVILLQSLFWAKETMDYQAKERRCAADRGVGITQGVHGDEAPINSMGKGRMADTAVCPGCSMRDFGCFISVSH